MFLNTSKFSKLYYIRKNKITKLLEIYIHHKRPWKARFACTESSSGLTSSTPMVTTHTLDPTPDAPRKSPTTTRSHSIIRYQLSSANRICKPLTSRGLVKFFKKVVVVEDNSILFIRFTYFFWPKAASSPKVPFIFQTTFFVASIKFKL